MDLKIKGKKINLRKLKRSDARSIQQHANDFGVYRYTSHIPYPYHLKHALKHIPHTWKELKSKTGYTFGIEDPKTGKIIGMISLLHIDPKSRNGVLGYWLGKKYWGRGITTEAVLLILNFGFDKLKLERIYAAVMHPNKASARVLMKCGFKPEGIGRKHIFKEGMWHDEHRFGLLREEFQKKRRK